MKVILGIIIVVFIFYFGSMGDKQRAERIAMIDGKPIVYADFQREYLNLVDMYRQRFGQGLTDEMLKSLNLKQQAINNLINQAVIIKKAEAMNVNVTDDDVKAMILAYPGFQKNGAFDQRIYEQTLLSNKMTPDEFESFQRKMLITMKVEDLIHSGVRVSDQEVNDIYRMQSEKINVDFIQISPKTFTGEVKAAPADLEAFLKAHEAQFRIPEQVQIKYLAFMGQDYAAAAKISDAEVADNYERNKNQWTKDKKVQPLAEVKDKIETEIRLVKGMYTRYHLSGGELRRLCRQAETDGPDDRPHPPQRPSPGVQGDSGFREARLRSAEKRDQPRTSGGQGVLRHHACRPEGPLSACAQRDRIGN
jgi:peptidyl-prolyl cis-trans isomerase D